ncbi:MAG TPA: response regulator [Candidatus Dormibacteraeota bacterium]|nr:response regulator [Candidatus Dormibacteraeota bacterium]
MGIHVLYVEDDGALAEMYGYVLNQAGHQVSLARDGESGLRAAFDLDPDLVLLDMRLPKMPGLSVLEQLRRRLYRGEVWIMSNFSESGLVQRADADGASRWLVKAETTPGHLREMVDAWAASVRLDVDSTERLTDLRGCSVDDLPDPILIADDSGAYVAASNGALELLGYERAELLGKHIWDIAPDWEVPVAQQSFDAFKGHGAQTGDFVLRTKSGGLLTISYEAYAAIRRGRHMSILTPRTQSAA